MLAIFWNWNHRFLGIKDRGVYFAVLILLRVKCCMGLPFSSTRSLGRGRLKYSCRGPGPCSCSSCGSCSSGCSSSLARCDDCSVSEPPDCLFFSDVTGFLLFLPMRDRRLRPLLLTVILLVAHLARFVLSILRLSGLLLPLLVAPSPGSLGVEGVIVRWLRARPGQPELFASLEPRWRQRRSASAGRRGCRRMALGRALDVEVNVDVFRSPA